MLRRVMIPTMNKFERDSPYANGNWGAIVNRFRIAAAIVMEDAVMYRQAVDYYLNGYDNGSLPRYISETGQSQETGRDQGHAQLGLEAMADICEMAWTQGDDLWGALDNRLMKGFEYAARYNLGYGVPFKTWQDLTGLYCDWTEPGEMGRGKLWDIYQKPYDHYVKVKGQKMPYTKKVLALQSKAERKGESREVRVPGVKEGVKLHQVFTYPASKDAPLKDDYEVFVQPRGSKEWIRIDTYMAKVNASKGNGKHAVSEVSYCFFDFTGDVFVKVVSKNKKFRTARIRPGYRGTIANVQNDSTVQFLLFQPENVSVELDGDIVYVSDVLEVENVDPATGNIDYEGSVVINGSVTAGYTVQAKGNIEVKGVVEGATLEAGGNITIARGMNGMGRGVLKAGQNIVVKYLENVTAQAEGNVTSESILHSNVSAGNAIEVTGKKGFITGGKVTAASSIKVRTLGSDMGATTVVEVGVDPTLKRRCFELENQKKEIEKVLKTVSPALVAMLTKMKQGVKMSPDQVAQVQKLSQLEKVKKEELANVESELQEISQKVQEDAPAEIVVQGAVYPGTQITISGASMNVQNSIKYCKFVKVRGDVKVNGL